MIESKFAQAKISYASEDTRAKVDVISAHLRVINRCDRASNEPSISVKPVDSIYLIAASTNANTSDPFDNVWLMDALQRSLKDDVQFASVLESISVQIARGTSGALRDVSQNRIGQRCSVEILKAKTLSKIIKEFPAYKDTLDVFASPLTFHQKYQIGQADY